MLLSSFKLMEWKVGKCACVWKIGLSEKHLPKVFRRKNNLGKENEVIYARKILF